LFRPPSAMATLIVRLASGLALPTLMVRTPLAKSMVPLSNAVPRMADGRFGSLMAPSTNSVLPAPLLLNAKMPPFRVRAFRPPMRSLRAFMSNRPSELTTTEAPPETVPPT